MSETIRNQVKTITDAVKKALPDINIELQNFNKTESRGSVYYDCDITAANKHATTNIRLSHQIEDGKTLHAGIIINNISDPRHTIQILKLTLEDTHPEQAVDIITNAIIRELRVFSNYSES